VQGTNTVVRWSPKASTAKVAVQAKIDGTWRTVKIVSVRAGQATIPHAQSIAVTALDRFGNASPPKVLGLP
jgi:hypothetical protein